MIGNYRLLLNVELFLQLFLLIYVLRISIFNFLLNIFRYDGIHSYSQGAFSFSLADCIALLDLNVMPKLLGFLTESSVTPDGDMIEIPFCSMSVQLGDC